MGVVVRVQQKLLREQRKIRPQKIPHHQELARAEDDAFASECLALHPGEDTDRENRVK